MLKVYGEEEVVTPIVDHIANITVTASHEKVNQFDIHKVCPEGEGEFDTGIGKIFEDLTMYPFSFKCGSYMPEVLSYQLHGGKTYGWYRQSS